MLCLTAGIVFPVTTHAGDKAGATARVMPAEPNKGQETAAKPVSITPVGRVTRKQHRVFIDIFPEFAPALDGLAGFSHIWVCYWFHENDTPENRAILKVHPRQDPANPLTGVFATRAPVRPNLIGLTACRLVTMQGTRLEVEGLDARDQSPILDIKPYIPAGDSIPEAAVPVWLKREASGKLIKE